MKVSHAQLFPVSRETLIAYEFTLFHYPPLWESPHLSAPYLYSALPRHVSGSHNWETRSLPMVLSVKARTTVKHLVLCKTAPTHLKEPSPSMSIRVQIEQLRSCLTSTPVWTPFPLHEIHHFVVDIHLRNELQLDSAVISAHCTEEYCK